MASKFGGREARENHWVMQQNLARHKSILGYVHRPQPPKAKTAPAAKPAPHTDATIEKPKTPTP